MLLRNQASNPQAVAVYDNINFADRKRHEEVGHTAVFHSFTNAAWVVCDELPEDGLFQEMHDSSVPLKLEDIALSRGIQGGDSFARDVSTYFIAEAIERLHHDAVANNVFKQGRDQFLLSLPNISYRQVRRSSGRLLASLLTRGQSRVPIRCMTISS